jgi:hypothetical protein
MLVPSLGWLGPELTNFVVASLDDAALVAVGDLIATKNIQQFAWGILASLVTLMKPSLVLQRLVLAGKGCEVRLCYR